MLTIPPDARARTAHTADAAQARLFDGLLQSEVQELEQLAASAERHWRRRREGRVDEDPNPPEALVLLWGRVAEVQGLLDALRARFPQR